MKKKGGKKPKKSVQPPGSAKRKTNKNTATKPHAAEKGPNPYDVFQNRRRRNAVLNERVRGEHRNLARSRTLATTERTQKLVREQLISGRSSNFRDGRIAADDDDNGSNVKRLVRLRQKEAKRSFTLGREEELMHEGRPLSTLEDAELRKSSFGEDDEDLDNVEDIIQQGRERKAEALQERAEHERQLGELDKDFSDIMGELNFKAPKAQRPIEKAEPDSYDRLLKEMVFQKRATATERTKTPEEIAQEQAEKLEALERERLARAEGLADDAPLHASDEEKDQEGEALGMAMPEDTAEEGEEGEEEEEKDDDVEVAVEAAAGGQGDDDDQDEDDRLGEACIPLMSTMEANKLDAMKNGPGEESLPFAPECPENRLAIERLLEGRSPSAALKLIQRVRARTALALSAENRSKIKAFFTALLDFALAVLSRIDGDISARGMTLVYALRRPLLELAREHTEDASTFFTERLRALGPDTAPKAEELACLKLIAMLFPVTDFQHPVVTPALLLADHWAAQLASMGAGIEDLVSEATMLWETLYELLLPGKKFCASFFQLGGALLESCASSAAQGRGQCRDAAVDIATLMAKALKLLSEEASALAVVAREELLRPALQHIPSKNREAISKALGLLEESSCSQALNPLRLFETGPAQIKMLDPIFHEEGDQPTRGMDASESKQLERKLNKERRAAARQLSRDAAVVQRIQNRKDDIRRAAQGKERKRVRRIMEVEKHELKQMATEFDKSMDTSFGSYSKNKERKKQNRRMAGNATAENPKHQPDRKSDKGSAPSANAEKPGGGKKKKKAGRKK
eukprot:TRINITY_DN34611_c0_g1_i1.p1 TRINITY_DN34611_c0_g1~~TRINITY_DN34611_c0_g1_i1.p1  ORF type:complete len:806 (+),score=195.64 TRINITY_DN34611_c0_g1_i1:86-2503(+)